jgi:hypothetical protein
VNADTCSGRRGRGFKSRHPDPEKQVRGRFPDRESAFGFCSSVPCEKVRTRWVYLPQTRHVHGDVLDYYLVTTDNRWDVIQGDYTAGLTGHQAWLCRWSHEPAAWASVLEGHGYEHNWPSSKLSLDHTMRRPALPMPPAKQRFQETFRLKEDRANSRGFSRVPTSPDCASAPTLVLLVNAAVPPGPRPAGRRPFRGPLLPRALDKPRQFAPAF